MAMSIQIYITKRRLLYGDVNPNIYHQTEITLWRCQSKYISPNGDYFMAMSIQIYITKFHATQLDIKTASSPTLLKHGTT